jgi:Domain of unknown function (DUF4129)
MSTGPYPSAPASISRRQAQQLAAHELGKSQYHDPSNAPSGQSGGVGGGGIPSGQPTPTASVPSPPPSAQHAPSAHVGSVLLIVIAAIVLVVVGLLIFRHFGKPRADVKPKSARSAGGAFDDQLTGAAAHRRDAEAAARRGRWDEAIRERFRAVIATLDERGLLPERRDRTADEAARDAGYVLPEHAAALATAARSFDDVEYGELVGSEAGYALISAVDEQVAQARVSAPRPVRSDTVEDAAEPGATW